MNFVHVVDGIADRTPVPDYLPHDAEALVDLSWLDPAFGLTGHAWWPEQVIPVDFDPAKQILADTETLTLDLENKVVLSKADVRDLDQEELAVVAEEIAATGRQLAAHIDVLVAGRLSDNSVFFYGYQQRELVALAYREAGYTGEEDEWVSSFSEAAGMSYKDAVDLVITQGQEMRTAVKALESLRMGKFRILRQSTRAQMQLIYNDLVQSISAVVMP